MSEVKHTPGPWTFASNGGNSGYGDAEVHRIEIIADDWVIATVIGDVADIPFEANARLIAAAPELLDALTDCLNALTADTIGRYDMDCPDWYRQVDAAVAKARAALAKAEGE